MYLFDLFEDAGKKLVIFDIDDTLVNTRTQVTVRHNGRPVHRLNSHEFTHYKLKPGEEFDFGAFRNAAEFARESRPIVPMIQQLNADIATGNRVVMITARADFDDRDTFLNAFRRWDVDIDRVHVYRAGNDTRPIAVDQKKADIIRRLLANNQFSKAIMYDDSVPNLESFVQLHSEHPGTRFYAWHVDHAGRASEYHRAFRSESINEHNNENDQYVAYDKILIDLCAGIVQHQKQDSDRYGLVAAAVVDPKHRVVKGINHKLASGKRVHAERAAMANYIKQHGAIPEHSIVVTTLSPCTDDMPDRKGPSCTELLNGSPITRVYAGYRDPSQTHLSHDDFDVVYTQNSKIESVCKQIADCFLKESAYTDPANYCGEGVAEAFDKPHKTKLNELFTSYGGYELHHNPRNADRGYIYSFDTKDKRDGEIIIKPKRLKQGVDSIVFVEFNIDGSTDTSGKGDAIMIFSTVLKAVNGFAREYKPQYIVFETEDPEKLKLYRRLVKYFVGYKPVDWTKDTVLNRQIGPELSGFAEEAIVLQRQDNADSIKTQSPSQGLYVIYGRGKYAGQVWHRFDLDSTVTPVGRYTREDQAEKFADEWVEKNGKRLGNQNMNYPYDWYLAKDPSGLEFGPAPAGQYSQVSQQDIEYIAWYLSQQQNLDKQGVAEDSDNNRVSFKVQKGKNKFATTLSIGGNPVGVYQYDANTGRSIAEVYPEFKGKGLGKLLVLHAIYTAAKLGLDFQEDESRTSEYDNVLDSLSSSGYIVDDDGYWYVTGEGEQFLKQSLKQGVAENFEDGRNPGRKGLAKRSGVNTKASVSSLRKTARHSTGEKARMAHWLANMKAGRAKKK